MNPSAATTGSRPTPTPDTKAPWAERHWIACLSAFDWPVPSLLAGTDSPMERRILLNKAHALMEWALLPPHEQARTNPATIMAHAIPHAWERWEKKLSFLRLDGVVFWHLHPNALRLRDLLPVPITTPRWAVWKDHHLLLGAVCDMPTSAHGQMARMAYISPQIARYNLCIDAVRWISPPLES